MDKDEALRFAKSITDIRLSNILVNALLEGYLQPQYLFHIPENEFLRFPQAGQKALRKYKEFVASNIKIEATKYSDEFGLDFLIRKIVRQEIELHFDKIKNKAVREVKEATSDIYANVNKTVNEFNWKLNDLEDKFKTANINYRQICKLHNEMIVQISNIEQNK